VVDVKGVGRRVGRSAGLAGTYAKALAGSVLPGGEQDPADVVPMSATAEVAIDPDKLARYRQVCGFPPEGPLPVPYPHILGFPSSLKLMTARRFPFPLLGLVHTRNRILVRRPVAPDAVGLTVEIATSRLFAHPKGMEVDVTTILRQDGQAVWEETSTYLRRGRPTHEVAGEEGGHLQRRARPNWPDPPADASRTAVRVAGDIGRRYSAVAGDVNPIHLTAVTAKPFGFNRPIAHGMWSLANTLAVAVPDLGERPTTVDAGFRKPLFVPGDAIIASAPDGGATLVWLTDGQGQAVHLVARVEPG
jgi:acyl dehydratase